MMMCICDVVYTHSKLSMTINTNHLDLSLCLPNFFISINFPDFPNNKIVGEVNLAFSLLKYFLRGLCSKSFRLVMDTSFSMKSVIVVRDIYISLLPNSASG